MNDLMFKQIDSLNEIHDLRVQYLDSLLEAQELYLELMIKSSSVFVIELQTQRIGYFVLGDESTLLEYYIVQDYVNHVDTILGMMIDQFSIRAALCKSFDHTLLSCCVDIHKKVNVLGINFREYVEKEPLQISNTLTVRPAKAEDEQMIWAVNEEVFEQAEEVEEYIAKNQILIFEQDDAFVGFGIFARVIKGRPEFDVGMLVHQDYRGQGYGEYIVRYLVNYCNKNGWRGICGCAIENKGSRRCLEKAGFIAGYRLLEFVF